MHGARSTRTFGGQDFDNCSISCSAPAMAHDRLSQTRMVTAGGGEASSFTTSKCA